MLNFLTEYIHKFVQRFVSLERLVIRDIEMVPRDKLLELQHEFRYRTVIIIATD